MFRLLCFLAAVASALSNTGFAASPYVGEESRSIKALSDQEVADYLAGKGSGLAKAAELNGYPGPAHVLELADELALTPEQRERTARLFRHMQARASTLGARLVDQERALDRSFAAKTISREDLDKAMISIATTHGEIRETHLQAHLEQAEILSEAQNIKYSHLRGYGGAGTAAAHHPH